MSNNNKKEIVEFSRRSFLSLLGWLSVLASFLFQGLSTLRAMIPNVLYEPSKKFKIGVPSDFPEGVKFLAEKRLFVFKENNTFYCISAICTHLGCTVNYVQLSSPQKVQLPSGETITENHEFFCPCHGSKYRAEGSIYAGPAPAGLPWYKLTLAPDGQIIVDSSTKVDKNFRLKV